MPIAPASPAAPRDTHREMMLVFAKITTGAATAQDYDRYLAIWQGRPAPLQTEYVQ
jgi:hypothetical protein